MNSSSVAAPKSEWLCLWDEHTSKFYTRRFPPTRPAVTKAGPSTPVANARAKAMGKTRGKGKGEATYVKQESLVSSGIINLH